MVNLQHDDMTAAVFRLTRKYNSLCVGLSPQPPWPWVRVRLSDGHVFSQLYDNRPAAAIAGTYTFPMALRPEGIGARAARNQLQFHRDLHDSGCEIADKAYEYHPSAHLLANRNGDRHV